MHENSDVPAGRPSQGSPDLSSLFAAAIHACRRTAAGRVHRFLLSARSRFCQRRFSRSTTGVCPPGSDELRRTLLPTHLPVRPAELFSQRLSSCRRSRQCRRRLAWLIAECVVSHLCFHELGGCCSESALSARLGPYEVSLEQQLQFHFFVRGRFPDVLPHPGSGTWRCLSARTR